MNDRWYAPKPASPPSSDEWKKSPSKKDRKRWCGGHVGREHQPVLQLEKYANSLGRTCGMGQRWTFATRGFVEQWICWHQDVCSVCGRIMGYRIDAESCPSRT
jgi:hypothetical protein